MGGMSYPITPREQIQQRILEIPQKYLVEELESALIDLSIAKDKMEMLLSMVAECTCNTPAPQEKQGCNCC
jgi:hypothetical protein